MTHTKPLRIAMLSIHSSPLGPLGTKNTGGMSVYICEVARILGARGHFIDIFTYTRGPRKVVDLFPNVRLIHLLGTNGREIPKDQMAVHLNDIFETLTLFCRSNQLHYDLIHSHYWLSGVVGAMAQAHWRCPHLTMFHTLGMVKNNTTSDEHESDIRIAHERWLAKVADFIVVPTVREKQNLLQHYHAPAKRIGLIPCGVNLARFNSMDRFGARERLGIGAHEEVVLFVGRFTPLKGLDHLIRAVGLIREQRPSIRLKIIGGDGPDDPTTQNYINLTAALALSDLVTFVGRVEQSDLAPYYCAADLLVLPSHYESFGLVVLESLACGTPVVATPVGTVETVLKNGHNGEIIQQPDKTHIARGIIKMLSQPRSRRASAQAVRATVDSFGWETVADGINQCYTNLLQSHNPEQAPVFYEQCHVFPN